MTAFIIITISVRERPSVGIPDCHITLYYTLYSEGKVRRWMARRGKKGRDLILENDNRSLPPLSLPRCIDLHRGDRQKCLMRRRWPLSGSTKPEILDVLGAAAATQTATRWLISADKKKIALSRFTFITSRFA